ncbi:MAG: energy-coupling factor ABC transporter permease [Synergistaceae bacterium]|jgi:cobalt/nickel transport system permease protein|nr:energy-coupling factor ABC transporter permease [Synergistaceae bacterium]
MADALLSPEVGGIMTVVSAIATGYAVKKISVDGPDEKKIPMMGIMGAFVFAGQMINFTIPGTGSSGHIGGGILLAALLGPCPALIVLASVLLIQCLFFADGGLLAYGCNVFNMGVCASLAWQYIYRPIAQRGLNRKNIFIASVASVVAGLQLGAFFVVLETLLSGITELPFKSFLLLMQPIHLAIGLGEGIATAAVLCFVQSARPELLESVLQKTKVAGTVSMKRLVVTFLLLTVLVGGGLSLFASAYPDGLEWSMEGVAGTSELERGGAVHGTLSDVVKTTAFMPDYSFAGDEEGSSLGTATAGIVGSGVTLALAGGIGLALGVAGKRRRKTGENGQKPAAAH